MTAPPAVQERGSAAGVVLTWRRPAIARAALLALVAALSALRGQDVGTSFLWVVVLVGLAAAATRWPPPSALGWTLIGLETVSCGLAIAATGGAQSVLLPYLLAPALCAGLQPGARAVVLVSGLSATALVTVRLVGRSDGESTQAYSASAGQWILLGLAAGLIAAWVQRLLLTAQTAAADPRYVEASRLLTELRGVARRLPGTLDTLSTSAVVLDELAEELGFDQGGVLLGSDSEHLTPVTVVGVARCPWPTSLRSSGPIGQAWSSAEPASSGGLLALPWSVGDRLAAVVVLERLHGPWQQDEVARARAALRRAELRLETALLFDDVRSLATVEERRRLGREIHDGIAQELVYLGYEMDHALDSLRTDPEGTSATLQQLRTETTRMIGELRLSVYDLRTTVDGDRGLAAALSDQVRRLGINSDMTVHLTLAQSGQRLPAAIETELLRIAQEAMSNARRHAGAQNLWVELVVEPPTASLRIEDDGRGVECGPDAGFGLQIMRERSERLGAEFAVRPRRPAGTCVSVLLRGRS